MRPRSPSTRSVVLGVATAVIVGAVVLGWSSGTAPVSVAADASSLVTRSDAGSNAMHATSHPSGIQGSGTSIGTGIAARETGTPTSPAIPGATHTPHMSNAPVAPTNGRDAEEPTANPTPADIREEFGDWALYGPPVDGDLEPIGADTSGHVVVSSNDQGDLVVTITDFRTDAVHADMRVQLTAGDISKHDGITMWSPDGDPVEIGTIPDGADHATIDVKLPQILPDPVHSLIVLDWNTSMMLGGCELIPLPY